MEQDRLFTTKWDQSRWALRVNIDLALREIEVFVIGYGGKQGNLVCSEGATQVPVDGWGEAFAYAVSTLWAELERQLDPNH